MNRRQFAVGVAATMLPAWAFAEGKLALYNLMPDEGVQHRRTWMAFVARDSIWGASLAADVKANLALLANTIAQYEPVSMLVAERDRDLAETLLFSNPTFSSSSYPIELVEFSVDDLWMRDSGPAFVARSDGKKLAVDFNFNGWGGKQQHARDALVAGFVAQKANVELIGTELVLEGGCFEVDGAGTAILTKSCVLNDNRNPGWTQKDVEAELLRLLGIRKVIWLNGIKGRDITDGHTDFYARFSAPGRVLVSRDNYRGSYDFEITRENIAILSGSADANGRQLQLAILDAPNKVDEQYGLQNFAAGYIGYYLCNGAVIAQKFGDEETDAEAKAQLQLAYPSRVIEQLAIDAIAAGGGSIHCATQQEFVS